MYEDKTKQNGRKGQPAEDVDQEEGDGAHHVRFIRSWTLWVVC